MKVRLLCLLILAPLLSLAQIQIEEDIDGEMENDACGIVSLSSDGLILAVGSPRSDANGRDSGRVRVFKNELGTWTQIGNHIDGEAEGDISGSMISLSSDGSILAIAAVFNEGNGRASGHVRVYKNLLGTWTQIGSDIDSEARGDLFGNDISLSSDGNILAIGAPLNNGMEASNSGHVRVYENVSDNWVQIGDDIDGIAEGDKFGNRVSLSSDGSIVAISKSQSDVNGIGSGCVQIYKNISGVWTQIGGNIEGDAEDDRFGNKIDLSSDGSIVAISGPSNDSNGINSGYVKVYENILGIWTQIGKDILGESEGDIFGVSVKLSSDGTVLAVGASKNDGNGIDSGHVRIFKNINGVWIKNGIDIDGEAENDRSGFSISLSDNGNVIAIGAPRNDGVGLNSGHVRIYDLNVVLSTKNFKKDYFSLYPNPIKAFLNIELHQGLELKKISIYNNLGQFINSSKKTKLDTSNLTSGFYFIEVETNQGKSVKKIVIE